MHERLSPFARFARRNYVKSQLFMQMFFFHSEDGLVMIMRVWNEPWGKLWPIIPCFGAKASSGEARLHGMRLRLLTWGTRHKVMNNSFLTVNWCNNFGAFTHKWLGWKQQTVLFPTFFCLCCIHWMRFRLKEHSFRFNTNLNAFKHSSRATEVKLKEKPKISACGFTLRKALIGWWRRQSTPNSRDKSILEARSIHSKFGRANGLLLFDRESRCHWRWGSSSSKYDKMNVQITGNKKRWIASIPAALLKFKLKTYQKVFNFTQTHQKAMIYRTAKPSSLWWRS